MHRPSEIHKHEDELEFYRQLNRQLTYLIGLILLVFLLGILAYGEKFLFWEHALSYIGGMQTQNGEPNSTSLIIYTTGMVLCSLVCFRVSTGLSSRFYRYLFKACGAGFILMTVPCDLFNFVHTTGAAIVLGTLWLFTVLNINELFPHHKSRVLFYHLILQGTVLPYVYLFAIGSPHRQAAQKLAVLGLILILKIGMLERIKKANNSTIQ
jgi:hypothetical protein